jgi:hypothetical protein
MDVSSQQYAWISIFISIQTSALVPSALGLWPSNFILYQQTLLDMTYPKCFHCIFFAYTSTSGQHGFKSFLDTTIYQDFSMFFAVLPTQTISPYHGL